MATVFFKIHRRLYAPEVVAYMWVKASKFRPFEASVRKHS